MSIADAGLYVVATPLGNLEDISRRALDVLGRVDLIAAEDTRHSRRLLAHYGIQTPLTSFHEHNERDKLPGLLARLAAGESLALISGSAGARTQRIDLRPLRGWATQRPIPVRGLRPAPRGGPPQLARGPARRDSDPGVL